MNEITIAVKYDNDNPTVSGRELHAALEVQTPYRMWFPRMCEYGFTENVDYSVTNIFVHHSKGGSQGYIDHQLTIDMAKELCMIQRTEIGKCCREYFINLEKQWNSPETDRSHEAESRLLRYGTAFRGAYAHNHDSKRLRKVRKMAE